VILLVDNYDSFVFNLARYFERLGQPTEVVRNDAISVADVRARRPDALVLSPGPCTPREAGSSLKLVRELYQELPILGVCLGHQTIVAALGGKIVRAPEPMHGRVSEILHTGEGVFSGLPNPLTACRYHSLIADPTTLPDCLRVDARTADNLIMAVAHHERPIVGWQFHPESILTDVGYPLLAAFLRLAGIAVTVNVPTIAQERDEPAGSDRRELPCAPVTF